MNKLIRILLYGAILSFSTLGLAQDLNEYSDDERDAIAVVENYLYALIAGDIPALEATLGSSLLDEKRQILDSHAYNETLVKRYAGSTFKISGVKTEADGKVTVVSRLRLSGNHLMGAGFILKRDNQGSFKIVDEL